MLSPYGTLLRFDREGAADAYSFMDFVVIDPLLAPLKSFADFPKQEQWIAKARRTVLQRATRT